jgi:hypothetical protein
LLLRLLLLAPALTFLTSLVALSLVFVTAPSASLRSSETGRSQESDGQQRSHCNRFYKFTPHGIPFN